MLTRFPTPTSSIIRVHQLLKTAETTTKQTRRTVASNYMATSKSYNTPIARTKICHRRPKYKKTTTPSWGQSCETKHLSTWHRIQINHRTTVAVPSMMTPSCSFSNPRLKWRKILSFKVSQMNSERLQFWAKDCNLASLASLMSFHRSLKSSVAHLSWKPKKSDINVLKTTKWEIY